MLRKAENQPARFLPILFLEHVVLVQQLVLVEQAKMDTIPKTYILLKVPLKIIIPSQTEVTHMDTANELVPNHPNPIFMEDLVLEIHLKIPNSFYLNLLFLESKLNTQNYLR